MTDEVLRHEDSSEESPEKVWRALVEADDFNAWFPFDRDGDLAAGATIRFRAHGTDTVLFDGLMTEFRPPSVMEIRWDANETVRFEVEPEGDGTRFTLSNVFDELGKAARDAAGWHSWLDALGCVVGDTAVPPATKEGWESLRDRYAARFGPDASKSGPPDGHAYAE